MKIFGGLMVLLMGIIISIVAAWFSVTGMVALFNANAIGVMAMMVSLEAGKLVGAGWLKLNWQNPNVSFLHRYYLLAATCVLSLITSLGIYGYLSAGHLEQAAPQANIAVQSQPLQLQLQQKNDENARLGQRLNQIDQNIAVFLKNDQASKGLKASGSLKKERDDIQAKIDTNNTSINDLNTKLAPLKMQNNEVEAKLGPVKYFAALIGWDDDSAVRLVICLIVSVFDVFAVVLLLSAMTTLREWSIEREGKKERQPEDGENLARLREAAALADEGDGVSLSDLSRDERLERLKGLDEDKVNETDSLGELKESFELANRQILEASEMEKAELHEKIDAYHAQVAHLQTQLAEQNETAIKQSDDIVRLAGLRPEAEREIVATAIPILGDPMDKSVEREALIGILERNPGILNEIEQIVEEDVVEDMTDREKLLDLLEKNPSIINDMAELIASQITKANKPGDSWLKD